MRNDEMGGMIVQVANDGQSIKVSSDGANFRVAKTKEVIALMVAVQKRNDELMKQMNVARSSRLVRLAMVLAMKLKRTKYVVR
jgi:hypothetical protein